MSANNMKEMTIKEVYAEAIKDFEIATVPELVGIKTGYLTKSGKTYTNYFSNESFLEFVKNMPEKFRSQYDDASGGELKEKKGRYGYYPPKMASFASSSRMIYLLSRDVDGFVFEQNLSTGLGGPANLDGYYHNNDTYTFVEAKRQEIFDSHSPVKEAYRAIYTAINDANCPFKIKCSEVKDGEFIPTFSCNGKEIHSFDLKQMISHMLGISRTFIHGTSKYCKDRFTFEGENRIHFLYLLYNPSQLLESNNLTAQERKKIQDRYNAVVEEISECTPFIPDLFRILYKYQAQTECKLCEPPIGKFTFKHVDQEHYLSELLMSSKE